MLSEVIAVLRRFRQVRADIAREDKIMDTNIPNPSEAKIPTWQIITAGALGTFFLLLIWITAVLIKEPTDFQIWVFRVILAVAAAGLGALIPGFIQVTIPGWIRAGGAIALFVIVYKINPPALVANESTKKKSVEINYFVEDRLATLTRNPRSDSFGHTNMTTYVGHPEVDSLIRKIRPTGPESDLDPKFETEFDQSALRTIAQLSKIKVQYRRHYPDSEFLNEAWSLIPEQRSREGDLAAFKAFASLIYTDYSRINDLKAKAQRDELVSCLRALWPIDKSVPYPIDYRMQSVLLWRTDPTFYFRITNTGEIKYALDSFLVLVEEHIAIIDTYVSGPIAKVEIPTISLSGKKPSSITERLDYGLAPGDVTDFVVRLQSNGKGIYRLRFIFKSNNTEVWKSEPLNVVFST